MVFTYPIIVKVQLSARGTVMKSSSDNAISVSITCSISLRISTTEKCTFDTWGFSCRQEAKNKFLWYFYQEPGFPKENHIFITSLETKNIDLSVGKFFRELNYLLALWGAEIKFWDHVEAFVERLFPRDRVSFHCAKEMHTSDNWYHREERDVQYIM